MKDRDIKRRIGAASETVKITRAMQLVSASKMVKAERRLVCGRMFLEEMSAVVRRIAPSKDLSAERDVRKKIYVVVTGDKGLCGDYNHKVLEFVDELLSDETADVTICPVGQFGREYFVKKGARIKSKYAYLLQSRFGEEIRGFACDLKDAFLRGDADEIVIVYTETNEKQPARQERKLIRLFPTESGIQETEESVLEYEKDGDGVWMQYVWAQMSYAIACSEYAMNYKSMSAMQQATSNGEELVDDLKRQFNHARQEKITAELLDSRQDTDRD